MATIGEPSAQLLHQHHIADLAVLVRLCTIKLLKGLRRWDEGKSGQEVLCVPCTMDPT